MREGTEPTLLKGAGDAAARGDWQQAYQLLVEADASRLLNGPDLVLLAGWA